MTCIQPFSAPRRGHVCVWGGKAAQAADIRKDAVNWHMFRSCLQMLINHSTALYSRMINIICVYHLWRVYERSAFVVNIYCNIDKKIRMMGPMTVIVSFIRFSHPKDPVLAQQSVGQYWSEYSLHFWHSHKCTCDNHRQCIAASLFLIPGPMLLLRPIHISHSIIETNETLLFVCCYAWHSFNDTLAHCCECIQICRQRRNMNK